jgi:predicted CXXCH cytochrome family protein
MLKSPIRRINLVLWAFLMVLSASGSTLSNAAGPMLSDINGPIKNKHNLSSRNTGVTYRAMDNPADPRSTQICIFCHTPHNAVAQTALWNRKDPTRFFGHYSSATLVIDNPNVRSASQFGEPNGSSRLCLSCHDGQTALGAVWNGAVIQFPVGSDVISYTNLSSHHPVSFVYNNAVLGAILIKKPTEGYQLPPVSSAVKLDKFQRMQCTSCHDPHQDQSVTPSALTPFWVGSDHDAVCKECHNINPLPLNP